MINKKLLYHTTLSLLLVAIGLCFQETYSMKPPPRPVTTKGQPARQLRTTTDINTAEFNSMKDKITQYFSTGRGRVGLASAITEGDKLKKELRGTFEKIKANLSGQQSAELTKNTEALDDALKIYTELQENYKIIFPNRNFLQRDAIQIRNFAGKIFNLSDPNKNSPLVNLSHDDKKKTVTNIIPREFRVNTAVGPLDTDEEEILKLIFSARVKTKQRDPLTQEEATALNLGAKAYAEQGEAPLIPPAAPPTATPTAAAQIQTSIQPAQSFPVIGVSLEDFKKAIEPIWKVINFPRVNKRVLNTIYTEELIALAEKTPIEDLANAVVQRKNEKATNDLIIRSVIDKLSEEYQENNFKLKWENQSGAHFGTIYDAGYKSILGKDTHTDKIELLALRSLIRLGALTKEGIPSAKKALTETYKIHLMPKLEDLYTILTKFLNALKVDPNLRSTILSFKIKEIMTDKDLQESNPFPRIVIYPIPGKQNAQYVLDTLYKLFKNVPGTNITPRFNEKVTSLIYFAQGNADDKIELKRIKEIDEVFAAPEYIYFKHDFTGSNEDYTLNNPAQKSGISPATPAAAAAPPTTSSTAVTAP